MTITAIILNYKNYQDIRVCVTSLEKQILPENCCLHILIIDNGSNDDGTKHLQKDFPQFQYIFNSENYGFARGVNQGIDINFEQSDYFLLVNNDAELEPNCLRLMFAASDGKALVGPAIFYKNEPDVVWQGGGFFLKSKMNISVPDKNRSNIAQTIRAVDFLSGCVLLIPKRVIELVGRFDEKFFFYGEDLDFCLRAKKLGCKIIYRPEAKSWHNIKRANISRTSSFVLKNLAFSYNLIIKKHFPDLRFYGLLLFIFIYTPFRFYQIISGGGNWLNLGAWIKGGWQGWRLKI